MARDLQKEHQIALERGYYRNQKKWTFKLTGEYIHEFESLLELYECQTVGEFVRKIVDGRIIISKR